MKPSHHTERGFRNPWPDSDPRGLRDVIRWSLERRRQTLPADPAPGTFPVAHATFPQRATPSEVISTWIGHSTVLLQVGTMNVLTDPMWSPRASPLSFAGPKRFVDAAVDVPALPAIDAVVISHNHYDHLDRHTVKTLAGRMPEIQWFAPLGLAALLRRWGAVRVRELDWWQSAPVEAPVETTVTCLPAQHFSARGLGDRGRTLWCSWSFASGERRIFFAGDTAYHPEFRPIGERCGPFDLLMLPIGAYEPRWFMRTVHMNPPEAMRAYVELTGKDAGRVAMLPIHWGTFRLTDESMLEPPEWIARLWREAGFDPAMFWLLRHGETRRLLPGARPTRA